jgi:putative FmdB family regulatory protein
MPTYEFYCSDCRARFEVLRSMADADAPLHCSTCGRSQHVNRMISMFAVVGSVRGGGSAEPQGNTVAAGGGCCGGACGCGG